MGQKPTFSLVASRQKPLALSPSPSYRLLRQVGLRTMVQERPVRVKRRLSAILAADVAGYSRLMHYDEEATHAKLSALLNDAVPPQSPNTAAAL